MKYFMQFVIYTCLAAAALAAEHAGVGIPSAALDRQPTGADHGCGAGIAAGGKCLSLGQLRHANLIAARRGSGTGACAQSGRVAGAVAPHYTAAMNATPAPALPRRKLPTGIQNFAKLREEGCYYVDKTGLVMDLIESGSYFFLSRPRRFGKSLLVDTLKELFEGNRALFEGLAADTRWDWTKRYPVIRISFSDGVLHSRAELDQRIAEILGPTAEGAWSLDVRIFGRDGTMGNDD